MKKVFLFSLLMVTITINSFSQRSYGGIPPSFTNLLSEDKKAIPIPEIVKSTMNNNTLKTQFEGDSLFEVFSAPVDVDVNLNNSGRWDTLTTQDRIWRLKITSQTAYSIQLFFDNFFISDDAELYAYNEDTSMVLGAFTWENNSESGKFTIQPIKGESIILELFESTSSGLLSHLHVFKIGHAFKDIFTATAFGCNYDVTCPEAQGWENQIRSAVKLLLTTPSFQSIKGSGAMINNTANDGTPYLLTAFHVIDNEDVDQSTIGTQVDCSISLAELDNLRDYSIFVFNYQATPCGGSPTSMTQTIAGAEFIIGNPDPDFALLKLSSIDLNYNVYMAGWDNSGQNPSSSVSIHHPISSQYKKLFLIDIPLSTVASAAPCSTSSLNHWKTPFGSGSSNPYDGIEAGSSGGPLFSFPGRYIIGQVHAVGIGGIPCSFENYATFGKFSETWFVSNISYYLNPSLGSPFTCEGIDYNSTPAHCNNNVCDGDEDCMTDPSKPINCGGSICPPCAIGGIPSEGKCSFCDADKVLSGKIWDNKNKTYRAVTSITAENSIVKNGSDIKFIAGEFIELGPGFEVDESSNFEAVAGITCECRGWCLNCDRIMNNENSTSQENSNQVLIVNRQLNSDILVYPNPNNGKFSINIKDKKILFQNLEIYGSMGNKVPLLSNAINKTCSSMQIDISNLPKGIYIIKVQTAEGKIYTEKLIIQ